MIRVELDGLVKRFERVPVVDLDPDAPLVLPPGELTAVLGPPGSGKTTLARLVAGLERPDSGEVRGDGRPLAAAPPADRRIGMTSQEPSLWPHLSVFENVAFGLRARGIARRERRQRVDEALTSARIEGLSDRFPRDLTPTQALRAEMARALVVEPSLLIFDEPFGRIEPRHRPEFRDEIRRLHAEAKATTLVLTREVPEALALADLVAVIDLGRVVQWGRPEAVYARPADVFVAQFLGPTNLIQGQVETVDARGEVLVRTPLGRLIGRGPGGPVATGQPATVAIRPGSLTLGASVPGGSNRFAATLERLTFLGESCHAHLRGPGDWPIRASAPSSALSLFREGQSVTASVPPEAVLVLPGRIVPGRP